MPYFRVCLTDAEVSDLRAAMRASNAESKEYGGSQFRTLNEYLRTRVVADLGWLRTVYQFGKRA